MPKKGPILFVWIIAFPILITAAITIYQLVLGRELGLEQVLSRFFGYAVGGLFVSFIWYNVKKLNHYNEK